MIFLLQIIIIILTEEYQFEGLNLHLLFTLLDTCQLKHSLQSFDISHKCLPRVIK